MISARSMGIPQKHPTRGTHYWTRGRHRSTQRRPAGAGRAACGVQAYPATVPQTVQKRAPAGSGAPQPPHGPADLSTGAAASAESGGRGGGGGAAGAEEAAADAAGWRGVEAGAAAAGAEAPAPAVGPPGTTAPGGGAIND